MSDVIDLSLNSVTSVDGGYGHSAAISSGCLYTWGLNDQYQCGNGTNIDVATPTKISNDTDWVEVSCGDYHTLARKSNGTVFGWGRNIEDQCGVYHTPNPSGFLHVPQMCSGTLGIHSIQQVASGAIQIAAASNYSMILQDDQYVYAVGQSTQYQIGSASRSAWQILTNHNGAAIIAAGPNTSASYRVGVGITVMGVHSVNPSYFGVQSNTPQYPNAVNDPTARIVPQTENKNFIDLAIGNDFLLGVTNTNELHGFTFGRMDDDNEGMFINPTHGSYVPFPPAEAITPIGFSGVYYSEQIQGSASHFIAFHTSFMELFDNTKNYLRVAAGGRHAIMTTVEGEVYSFGNNNFYQLGRVFDGNDHNILEMTGSAGTGSWSVIGCGNNHSLICKE